MPVPRPGGAGERAAQGVALAGTSTGRGEARGLEEIFTDRFELGLKRVSEVTNPLDGKIYPIGRGAAPLFFHKESEIADRMKALGNYERKVLGEMPRNRLAVLRLRKSSFFGRGAPKVVIGAISLSPIEQFIVKDHSADSLGLADMNKAVDDVAKNPEVFYFLGLLSTTGWSAECKGRLPQGPNFLVAAVENLEGSRWSVVKNPDKRWGRAHLAFDPETRPEKLARCQEYFAEHEGLRLKGGHVVLEHARDDLGVPDDIFLRAVEDAAVRDPSVQVMEISGKKILKRSRV